MMHTALQKLRKDKSSPSFQFFAFGKQNQLNTFNFFFLEFVMLSLAKLLSLDSLEQNRIIKGGKQHSNFNHNSTVFFVLSYNIRIETAVMWTHLLENSTLHPQKHSNSCSSVWFLFLIVGTTRLMVWWCKQVSLADRVRWGKTKLQETSRWPQQAQKETSTRISYFC